MHGRRVEDLTHRSLDVTKGAATDVVALLKDVFEAWDNLLELLKRSVIATLPMRPRTGINMSHSTRLRRGNKELTEQCTPTTA